MALRTAIEAGVDKGALADVPANALAAFMLGLVDGLALHCRIDPGAFRSEKTVQRALEVMLRGLALDEIGVPQANGDREVTGVERCA